MEYITSREDDAHINIKKRITNSERTLTGGYITHTLSPGMSQSTVLNGRGLEMAMMNVLASDSSNQLENVTKNVCFFCP